MAQFHNIHPAEDNTWTIAIGDSPDFYVSPEGLNVNWRGQGKGLENTILASELRCTMRCDETHVDWITELGTVTSTGVPVSVSKNGTLWWVGVMQHEAVQLEYNSGAGYWFEIQAICGLGLLKEKEFDNEGVQYEGVDSLLGHVATCLKKLPWMAGTFSGADVFIRSAVGWLAVQHVSPNDNPMKKTWANRRVWYDYDSKGNVKKKNCYKVLENVLGILGARIWMVEGAWLIDQPIIRNENTFPGYEYDYDLNETAAALNGQHNIECGSDSARVAPGGNDNWMPPIRSAKFKWLARQRRNWLPGYNRNDQAADLRYDGDTLDYSNGKVALKITAKLRVKLTDTGYSSFDSIWGKFNLYFKVGDLYLRRDINLQNGVLTPSNYGWDVTIQNYEVTTGLMPSPDIIPNFQTTVNLQFTTPVMPTISGSGQFSFWIEEVGIFKAITGVSASGVEMDWEFFDTYVEVLVDGRPINGSQVIEYETKNIGDDFGEDLEIESLLADRVDANDLGGLFAGTSTTPSTFWGQFNLTRSLLLGRLWCEQMMRFRKKPRRRMITEFYGPYFSPWLPLWDGEKRWVFLAGSYTAGTDRMQGEWLELEKGVEALNEIDPKLFDIDPTFVNGWPGTGEPPPDGPGTGGNDERTTPALLYPLAANYTAEAILAGAVTEMELKYPTKAGVFVADDFWVVMDPATGRNFTATIVTSAEEGDTTVEITGTASDIIPAESMILYPLTNLTTTTVGAVRWKRWVGTVVGDELELPLPDYPLPADLDRLKVVVQGIAYERDAWDPTYTVDVGANKIIFSRTELDGFVAVIRVD